MNPILRSITSLGSTVLLALGGLCAASIAPAEAAEADRRSAPRRASLIQRKAERHPALKRETAEHARRSASPALRHYLASLRLRDPRS